MNSFLYLNLPFLIISIIWGLSTTSFFNFWMAMEFNLIMFLSLMMTKNFLFSSEIMMKYFIIQAFSSNLILWSFLTFQLSMSHSITLLIFMTALSLKLGLAPLHFWMISIAKDIDWSNLFIFSTLQKMLPLTLLLSNNYSHFLIILIMLSLFISVVGSFQSSLIKKLLAYSSMFNLSWMIASWNSLSLTFMFLFIYTLGLLLLISIFKYFNTFSIKQIMMTPNQQKSKIIILLAFMNLAGMPPFMGFFAKIIIIKELIHQNMILLPMILTMSSIFILYIYMRLSISTTYNSNSNFFLPKINLNYFIFISIITLTTPFLIMLIYMK